MKAIYGTLNASLGTGATYCMSSKQKINTRSSTEAEFAGVDDVLGQVLWA